MVLIVEDGFSVEDRMGQRLFIAGVIVTSSFWVSALEAGRPAPKAPAPHPAPRAAVPHPPAPHPNVVRPNTPHPQPNATHPNAAHTNVAHLNTAGSASGGNHLAATLHRQSMKGPQAMHGMAVLRTMAHSSRIHERLRHFEHWHHWHYWHHHAWGVGVYGLLPTNTMNTVTGVPSGNTLLVSGIGQPVRLAGVGTPFDGQGFASSRDSLDGIANGQQVRVFSVGMDANGNTVAQVFLNDGTYVNEQQIRSGTAWYSADDWPDMSLGVAEEQAQISGTGLWGGDYAANF
jgi:endonuclease YncB( thermonuclease family)